MAHYVKPLSEEQANSYRQILEELRQTKEWEEYTKLNDSNNKLLSESVKLAEERQKLLDAGDKTRAEEILKEQQNSNAVKQAQEEKGRKIFSDILNKFEKKAKDIPDFYQERRETPGQKSNKTDNKYIATYVEDALLQNLCYGTDFVQSYNKMAIGFNRACGFKENDSENASQNTERKNEVKETKEEERAKPETKTGEFDFEEFLAQLGKEMPDDSIISAGVEKFGAGHLNDAQKERFLKTIFPEENKFTSTGFKNMKTLRNAMYALVSLSEEGKFTQEQIKSFLMTQNPNGNGMNIVSTIALNIRASEFKIEHAQDKVAKFSIRKNIEDVDTALACLGQLDENIVQDIIKMTDNSEKGWSIEKLAASNKSKILSKFLDNPKGYFDNGYLDIIYPELAQNSANHPLNVEEENKTVVSGGDSVTIDGEKKKGLNVNGPQTDTDTEEKIAPMAPQEGEDKKRSAFPDWKKVEEQDIIKYMFENWFLSGFNWALKLPFRFLNKCLDVVASKFDTNIPKASLKEGEVEKNVDAVSFLNDRGAKVANNCMKGMETQKGYYEALADTIKENAGKDPKAWKVKNFRGKPVLDVTDAFDCMKMRGFNDELAKSSSEKDFKNKLDSLKEISEADIKIIDTYMQYGARLATAQYMAQNPNGPFDDSANDKLMKMAMSNTNSIMQTIKILNERMEFNYRAERNINTQLTDEQRTKLAQMTEPVIAKFFTEMTDSAADLRKSVYNYHDRGPKKDKDNIAQIMQTNLHCLNNILDVGSAAYIDKICPSKLKKASAEKISLFDLTKQDNESARLQGFVNSISQSIEAFEARKQDLIQIKQSLKNNHPSLRLFASKIKGKTERKFDEVKDATKRAFGREI